MVCSRVGDLEKEGGGMGEVDIGSRKEGGESHIDEKRRATREVGFCARWRRLVAQASSHLRCNGANACGQNSSKNRVTNALKLCILF